MSVMHNSNALACVVCALGRERRRRWSQICHNTCQNTCQNTCCCGIHRCIPRASRVSDQVPRRRRATSSEGGSLESLKNPMKSPPTCGSDLINGATLGILRKLLLSLFFYRHLWTRLFSSHLCYRVTFCCHYCHCCRPETQPLGESLRPRGPESLRPRVSDSPETF